ncbi:aminopeptidase N [Endozoicomonas montiporae]|uniref:Aminopeptidase N n=2 Tax=Endozoicomonas montiporae TaxID=1027273 RepID=A0A081NA00_9GAMM|nr:aminopeptidase N [Endozoicomonas montiporae]AMO57058.1 aminopeptidase N [Endozoicomonas montiporae CL-33]KEQ15273.1 aminopeptidase N [Endozoicomonas montiporae]
MKDAQPRTIYLKDYQAPDYWIDTTHLTFDLHEDYALVTSVLQMRLNGEKEFESGTLPALTLHGEELDLVSLHRDGEELEGDQYQLAKGTLIVSVKQPTFELQVVTRIRPQENTSLEGLYKSNGMFCTQCEAEGFRKITYYLDRPDVMSVFTTKVIASQARYPVLLANGNAIDKGELENDRHYVTWEDPFKKPSYLFALVAGDLECIEDRFTTMSGRDVTLKIFTESHNIHKCDHAMVSLKKSMRWDEEVYGREYDLDIFMIVAVDHFNMGAMENKGLNIFNSSCVLASPETATDATYQRIEAIVAHEYFHNWSGNRVTCRDWFQLSLKEGFTVFRDAEFSADMNSRGVKRIQDASLLRTAQFAEDAGPMAHPIRPESFIEISNFYTLTVYEKGCEVVRMIHTILGAGQFRKGTDLYFDRHDGEAATCEDFVKAMEDASGVDLTQFRHWYSQAGTPVMTVTDKYDAESGDYHLTIAQSCPATPGQEQKKPFHIPVGIALLDEQGQLLPLNAAGDKEQVLSIKQSEETFVVKGCKSKPLPSLLRNFSAPVRVRYDYSKDDLVFLMKHDTDSFNRWDACQRLGVAAIEQLVEQPQQAVDPQLVDAFGAVIADAAMDKAVKAEMLCLPSEASLAEQADVIQPLAIVAARKKVKQAIAVAHKDALQALYNELNHERVYKPEAADIAERTLKNVCLGYLSAVNEAECVQLAAKQYDDASNMTDRRAALGCVIDAHYRDEALVERLLTDFYDRYKGNSNVMDDWFAVQSSSAELGTVEKVKALMQHDSFDSTSPNKLRSLIGGFTRNMTHFHTAGGTGYEFLADRVIELDKQNPQVASRIMTPLTRWKKFEPVTSGLMKNALERIKAVHNLSTDVYEVVNKSL